LKETEYRRLRCPRCGFKADRDVIGKLNIRKGGFEDAGDQSKSRGISDHPPFPPDDRCIPE
jgi:transposase